MPPRDKTNEYVKSILNDRLATLRRKREGVLLELEHYKAAVEEVEGKLKAIDDEVAEAEKNLAAA